MPDDLNVINLKEYQQRYNKNKRYIGELAIETSLCIRCGTFHLIFVLPRFIRYLFDNKIRRLLLLQPSTSDGDDDERIRTSLYC